MILNKEVLHDIQNVVFNPATINSVRDYFLCCTTCQQYICADGHVNLAISMDLNFTIII